MSGYTGNIEQLTLANNNFRQVIFTGPHSQLVLMSLIPNEEIGMEVHADNDQFFRIEAGEGKVIIDGVETVVTDGMAVVVPAGSQHNVINTSSTIPLKLYTIYSPAHHPEGTVHATKAEAMAGEAPEPTIAAEPAMPATTMPLVEPEVPTAPVTPVLPTEEKPQV